MFLFNLVLGFQLFVSCSCFCYNTLMNLTLCFMLDFWRNLIDLLCDFQTSPGVFVSLFAALLSLPTPVSHLLVTLEGCFGMLS